MSIQALRERHSALAKSIANLLDKNVNPAWNADLEAKYNAQLADMDSVAAEIKRHDTFLARMTEHASVGDVANELRNQFTTTQGRHGEETPALRAFLAGGVMNMSEEARSRMQARQTPDIRAAMSTTTATEGGFTVAQDYFNELTQAMRAFGGVRNVARTLVTGTGATMNFPTADATAEIGEIVGQNTAVSNGDTTFGNATLDVFKYSSKKIAVPFELIQDSMFDIEGYVNALLALRLGRITAQHFAIGTGVSQPKGLVTAAVVGRAGATGQTATLTYDDLVGLEHSVDPVYRANASWMMHDQTLLSLRKIKDNNGRPIFVPGYEQGNPGGAPDRLLGRPIQICQEMPQMAANAKSLLFGDYSKYFIREVMDLTIFRMTDSAFTLMGQIGFVAFNRQGGNLIDVGGAVKAYQNSAT
ncbi:phage major capsid protein [Amantichitinum ursilacus]|uniref:Phage capsid family protein n=1 Tax=Amantichitinum ursilacus TaxID=857265 RepID=A0A0N0XL55_9NEIS|nr:phage major capsid protein [Amantichitinum ursilacus]KPC53020.1 Phage capsid family protein [Amantichitinum ursilacus]